MSRTPTQRQRVSEVELRNHLREQVQLLMDYCREYDAGKIHFAKPMATCLRVLLHSSPNPNSNTRALLAQLGLRRGRWRNMADAGHPKQQQFPCKIAGFDISAQIAWGEDAAPSNVKASCFPILKSTAVQGSRRTPYPEWWTEPVAYNVDAAHSLSRMDIVRLVADTDGGSHVDGSVDSQYAKLREGSFLPIRGFVGPNHVGLGRPQPAGAGILVAGVHLAAIRTIAHETLLSLETLAPDAFQTAYLWTAT